MRQPVITEKKKEKAKPLHHSGSRKKLPILHRKADAKDHRA